MTKNERYRNAYTFACATPPERHDEPVDGLAERNLRILEAVYHEAAVIASEDPSPPTLDEIDDDVAIAAVVARLVRGR